MSHWLDRLRWRGDVFDPDVAARLGGRDFGGRRERFLVVVHLLYVR